ncbi:MAG: ABC transporter ATP-binding protein, partial [Anaerolineales bacterium]
KTTTVRMLTSVLAPSRSSAQIAGYDVVKDARDVRRSVGVLTEQHGLYGRMKAADYLDFFGQVYDLDRSTRRSQAQRLLGDFGLLGDSQRRIGEYSKGMRQKLALARAMLHDPPVLLLDEPTSAMDPESARLVRDSIRELRSARRSIVICTHNLAEAEELADHIAIIRSGRIVANGRTADLKQALLGPLEYEVKLAASINGDVSLPRDVTVTAKGDDWLRYSTLDAERDNPVVLRHLLGQGLAVVSLQEVPRSLEQVYLHAMGRLPDAEAMHA